MSQIWLHKDTKYNTGDIVCGYQYEFAQEIECEGIENFVEYVPKDDFIDKAIQFLESTDFCKYYNQEFIDEFRRKMEE